MSDRKTERSRPTIVALLGALALLIVSGNLVAADRTMNARLIVGQGLPVCEAYVNEIHSNGQLPAGTECLEGSSRQIVGLSLIDLGPMFSDATETLSSYWDEFLEKQVIDYLWERDANPAYYLGVGSYAQWRGTRAQFAEAKRIFGADVRHRYNFGRRVASIDVDNDGTPERVLYLPDLVCGGGRAMPIVLSADLRSIDRDRTSLIAPHPSRASGVWREGEAKVPPGEERRSPYADAFWAARYTFFTHQGKIYFSLGWAMPISDALRGAAGRKNSMRRERVFIAEEGRTREVCAVEYQD